MSKATSKLKSLSGVRTMNNLKKNLLNKTKDKESETSHQYK